MSGRPADRAADLSAVSRFADELAGDGAPFDAMGLLFDQYIGVWGRLDPAGADWLAGQLPPPGSGGGSAVDLGCGAGRNTVLLADRYDQVLALDASELMLSMAGAVRDRPNITWRWADLRPISPHRHGTHQLVLSMTTIHHLGPPGVVLPQIRSLVAPGGRAVLVDMIDPGGWATDAFHLDRAFTEARAVYDQTGDRRDVADVLALLLHPVWLTMVTRDIPLTRDQFTRHYTTAFPGAVITDLTPNMAAAVWHNPDPGPTDPPADHPSSGQLADQTGDEAG